MKTITFLFFASLFFVAQSSQESPELKEATALTDSVVTLFNERKFDEALPLARRALEIRERLLPAGDPQISTSLSYLADVYIAKRSYAARLARFSPTKLSGMPVKVAGVIPVQLCEPAMVTTKFLLSA